MRVNKTKMKVKTKEILGANILEVGVGSNCPQGGDAGAGGRTYLRLRSDGTDWEIRVKDNYGKKETLQVNPSELEIVLAGDSEAKTFLECLKFAAIQLEKNFGVIKENGH